MESERDDKSDGRGERSTNQSVQSMAVRFELFVAALVLFRPKFAKQCKEWIDQMQSHTVQSGNKNIMFLEGYWWCFNGAEPKVTEQQG